MAKLYQLFTSIKLKGPVNLALFYLAFSFCAACSTKSSDSVLLIEGQTMGTSYHIKIVDRASDKYDPDTLKEQIEILLAQTNRTMSTYLPQSELSELNQARPLEWLKVSPNLYQVLELSLDVCALSGGAFDITVGPLVSLWGFGSQGDAADELPSKQKLKYVMENVGCENLQLRSDSMVYKKRAVDLDLSGVAKGYGVDLISILLQSQNIENYMIEIGGELYGSGVAPSGKPWRIGIEAPELYRGTVVQAVSVSNRAIATSGDYRNYREVDGRRISHTVDPNTGMPIEHKLASVTVIAANTALADALATGLNVLGPDRGYELALKENLAAYFIVREGNTFNTKYTPQFEMHIN